MSNTLLEELKEQETKVKRPRRRRKELEGIIVIEIDGEQFDILDLAKYALEDAKEKGAVEERFDIYIKPDERTVYYVADGNGGDDYKVQF